jgi:hypothetical protein
MTASSPLHGTSVEQIDKTYGHLLPDALDRRQARDGFAAQVPIAARTAGPK